jgi:hypothetical protein
MSLRFIIDGLSGPEYCFVITQLDRKIEEEKKRQKKGAKKCMNINGAVCFHSKSARAGEAVATTVPTNTATNARRIDKRDHVHLASTLQGL